MEIGWSEQRTCCEYCGFDCAKLKRQMIPRTLSFQAIYLYAHKFRRLSRFRTNLFCGRIIHAFCEGSESKKKLYHAYKVSFFFLNLKELLYLTSFSIVVLSFFLFSFLPIHLNRLTHLPFR